MTESNSRFFPNPWLNDRDCRLENKQKKEKLQEALLGIRPRLLLKIEEYLTEIDEFYRTTTSDQSVYTGSAGIALLHLHLALQLCKTNPDKKQTHLLKSLSFLTPSLANLNTRRHTFLNGPPGPLSIAAVVYISLGRDAEGMRCIETLVDLYKSQKEEFQKIPCELLYGCAGYLYSLLFVNRYIKNVVPMELIEEIRGLLISRGQSGCEMTISSPLVYTWHDKHYLGAAHGFAGILTVLLQDAATSSLVSRHLSVIQHSIDYLMSVQFPSKNYPSSLESSDRDRLVQWCHGAPGFVHLWSTAYRVFNDSKYLQAARECGEVVWERGLLKKGCDGLCHGVAGNGYTFLQLYNLTNESCYLYRAIKFAEWCLDNSNEQCFSHRSLSLFEGLSGKIYYFSELCQQNPEDTRFPGLELPC